MLHLASGLKEDAEHGWIKHSQHDWACQILRWRAATWKASPRHSSQDLPGALKGNDMSVAALSDQSPGNLTTHGVHGHLGMLILFGDHVIISFFKKLI